MEGGEGGREGRGVTNEELADYLDKVCGGMEWEGGRDGGGREEG